MSSECPGVGIASIASLPDLQRAARDRQAELALVRDVVGVAVRPQDVGGRDAPLLGRAQERLERRPRVDEDGRAAGLVARRGRRSRASRSSMLRATSTPIG